MPYGMLGKAKLSRLFLGGNLVAGFMHCRDLKYVNDLFRAYVTEDKIMQTFKLAEEQGINVVFETGGDYVARYNKKFGGHMKVIPSIHPDVNQSDAAIKDEIKRNVDAGVPAMYVWGVRGRRAGQHRPGRRDRQGRRFRQGPQRAGGRRRAPALTWSRPARRPRSPATST